MKFFLITCMFFSQLLVAEEYSQANRILDMQKMAQAMQDIQSGFFYNNLDIVTAGIEDLKATVVKVKPTEAEKTTKDVYEKWMNNATAMTGRTQKRIQKYSETMLERFQEGDVKQALNVYNRITAECLKCHTSLRKW
ncbi:MAG TPA: cytochrome C [Sulfurovum sp.]|nr:cytochrome C [Sulfurovum sp.]